MCGGEGGGGGVTESRVTIYLYGVVVVEAERAASTIASNKSRANNLTVLVEFLLNFFE